MRKKLLITTQILVLLTSLIGIGTYANSSKDILLQEVPKFQQENKVAVIIGVNTYDRSTGLRPLKYAASDATNLKNTLIKQGYKVRLLTNHHAGKHMILNAIEQAGKTLKRNTGTFIFAYSGHGFASNKQNYLASHGTVINRLAQSALPLREVQQAIRRTGAKRAILFIDACRNDPNIAGSKSVASTGFIYSKSEGIKTLYATKFGEVSWESPQLRHGVFSHFLIKALRGEAADRNGVISFSSVEKYVQQNVSNWTFSHRMPNTQLPFSNGNSFGVLVLGQKAGSQASSSKKNYDLEIKKYVGISIADANLKKSSITARPRTQLIYRIDYKNPTNSTATPKGTKIYDDYDQEKLEILQIISTCSDNGDIISCNGTDLAPGEYGTIYYKAQIKANVTGDVINIAEIVPDNDINRSNNTGTNTSCTRSLEKNTNPNDKDTNDCNDTSIGCD